VGLPLPSLQEVSGQDQALEWMVRSLAVPVVAVAAVVAAVAAACGLKANNMHQYQPPVLILQTEKSDR
jgi:anti-sigma-K factor RskA